ncbi:MAG: endonuclease/exonuclease/phosphatase family protein [Pseudomonadales bacterium]
MLFRTLWLISASIFLVACANTTPNTAPLVTEQSSPIEEPAKPEVQIKTVYKMSPPIEILPTLIDQSETCSDGKSRGNSISIASWNINKNSGYSEEETNKIVSLLKNYDMVVFQEVDKTHGPDVIKDIVSSLNESTRSAFAEPHISQITGSGKDAERYAIIWKHNVLEKTAGSSRSFVRELDLARDPFWAHFQVKVTAKPRWPEKYPFDFIIYATHAKAAYVSDELEQIAKGIRHIEEYTGEPDIIVAGSLNSGPGGQHYSDFNKAFRNTLWSIGPSVSTLVPTPNPNSKAAAVTDNLLFGPATLSDYAGSAAVIRFDRDMDITAARSISNHRIIEAEFCTDNDDDA